ncbi:tetraticopeptide domain-containing thioredoxin [Tasmannia lanceolata]|uniref:tetraticopeptide domain-containing thioredoxin n=1 Tax=Tasmannia lanceolata TaxID=3420 RepID=UPI00406281ED
MDAAKVAHLKLFVDQCKSNPSILNDPSLGFFTTYLQSLGARIPKTPKSESDMLDDSDDDTEDVYADAEQPKQKTEDDDMEDDIVESDIELDGEVVKPDNDPPQKMGDPSVEVTEESRDAAQMSKAKAMDAISEGKLDEAIEHLTVAIVFNSTSAIPYANRASVFVKMNKPNAAIRDADAAIQINPDSAKGYKARGMARALMGQWEEAANDLHIASKLDYDEEIGSVLKKVEPNAHKIEEHRRKYERLRKQRELRKAERTRQRRRAEAQAAYEKEKKTDHFSETKSPDPDPNFSAALQEGSVLSIHSAKELETKFNAASSLSRLAVLYFTAAWCGPCRFISPLYANLAAKYPNIVFLKVDIDELKDVAARWNINSVPTIFFTKNGKEIDKVVGADKNELEKKIAQYAGQS